MSVSADASPEEIEQFADAVGDVITNDSPGTTIPLDVVGAVKTIARHLATSEMTVEGEDVYVALNGGLDEDTVEKITNQNQWAAEQFPASLSLINRLRDGESAKEKEVFTAITERLQHGMDCSDPVA